ncbi:MAG: zinc ribbon domain-containing protein [Anaerolineales bacterium]|nr:zinc ribbon domain-containing protein [Anaerolineales bacterium]
MRKFFLMFILVVMLVFPTLASAQADVTLSNVSVQLWPEYDQPSMLVIVDFQVAADTVLPVDLVFRLPQDANLIAVASYTADGSLMNAVFDGPVAAGDGQSFTVTAAENTVYRFEYYQPLTFNGEQRLFSYLWDGDYTVNEFSIRVLEPVDITSLSTIPELSSISQENGLKYFDGENVKLASGEQFTLNLEYKKTSNTLIASSQGVQPVAPVDASTTGRVSLNNYLPYVIGGLGVIMIVGGLVYYWQSGKRNGGKKSRRRQSANTEQEEAQSDVYCAQCGTRAHGGDRFCRTCGSRIRQQEE